MYAISGNNKFLNSVHQTHECLIHLMSVLSSLNTTSELCTDVEACA